MPLFCTQRALYEARERPSKTYAWQAFLGAQILVEIPWQTLMAVIIYFGWYYPIGLYTCASFSTRTSSFPFSRFAFSNATPTGAVTERGGLMFLLIWMFMLFTSTYALLCSLTSPLPVPIAHTSGHHRSFAHMSIVRPPSCSSLRTPANLPLLPLLIHTGCH